MALKRLIALTTALGVLSAPGLPSARERDPDTASRAQERMDRDLSRTAQRSEEMATRYAEERARITERAIREPDKAASDLAKLDADYAREQQKVSEDVAKISEDFAKKTEDGSREATELAERSDDPSAAGSSQMIRDLGESEGAEHDEHGFPVRRGELVGIDLRPTTLEVAQTRGFRVIERQHLEALGRDVIRISVPAGMTALDGRKALHEIDPEAVVDLVHYYGLNLTAGGHGRRIKGGAPLPHAAGSLSVGVIDTAIQRHPALGNARLVPWQDGNQPGAPVAHGTAVASLIAGEGDATIYSANIFRGPANRPFTSADVIAQALEWTLAQGAPTINMSLAGPRNAILDRLIRDALAGGRTIVAAAGNGGPTAPPAYPAAVPGVVAVTAVDKDLRIYRYANRGRYITVAAHGVDVVAANAPGGYARFTGTSFATPHVTGWLARCRSAGKSASTCNDQLRRSAHDLGGTGFDEIYGYGVID